MDREASADRPYLQPDPQGPGAELELSEEIDKRKARAARFNTPYKEAGPRAKAQSIVSSERQSAGFKTGMDLFNPEEQVKREARAARFATASEPTYKPIIDEENAKRRERAARFGTEFNAVDHSGLQEQDILEERKDHSAAVQRRPEAVHLYGVDRMSTRECLLYFGEYGPGTVEWLDDSSCNVVFADADSAKRAMIGKGRPFSPVEDADGIDLSDMQNLPFLWHKGEDFQIGLDHAKGKGLHKAAAYVPLIFRMATIDDKKGMIPAKPSRHLWQDQARADGKGHSQMKRRRLEVDEDGDVVMGLVSSQRKARGGKKARKRKLRLPSGVDVEMHEAQDQLEEVQAAITVPEDDNSPQGSSVPDLRGTLTSSHTRSGSDQNRLFSARSAGIETLDGIRSQPDTREVLAAIV